MVCIRRRRVLRCLLIDEASRAGRGQLTSISMTRIRWDSRLPPTLLLTRGRRQHGAGTLPPHFWRRWPTSPPPLPRKFHPKRRFLMCGSYKMCGYKCSVIEKLFECILVAVFCLCVYTEIGPISQKCSSSNRDREPYSQSGTNIVSHSI